MITTTTALEVFLAITVICLIGSLVSNMIKKGSIDELLKKSAKREAEHAKTAETNKDYTDNLQKNFSFKNDKLEAANADKRTLSTKLKNERSDSNDLKDEIIELKIELSAAKKAAREALDKECAVTRDWVAVAEKVIEVNKRVSTRKMVPDEAILLLDLIPRLGENLDDYMCATNKAMRSKAFKKGQGLYLELNGLDWKKKKHRKTANSSETAAKK